MGKEITKTCLNCRYEYDCDWKRCGEEKENWRPDLEAESEAAPEPREAVRTIIDTMVGTALNWWSV